MIRINFFVIDENKYSLSPLISIAEEFPFSINLIKLPKTLYNLINYNEINQKLHIFFNNLEVKYKVDKKNQNIFILSWTTWYRRFFIGLSKFLQINFPESIILSGGADVTGSYNILKPYFDTLCVGEGELFFFKVLDLINKNKKDFGKTENQLKGIFINNKKNIFKLKNNKKENFTDLNDILSLIKLYIKKHKNIGIEISRQDEEQIFNSVKNSNTPVDLIFQISAVFPTKIQFFHPSEITRGCSGLCYFCQTPFISGFYERHKNIYILLKYLEYSLNFSKFYFRFISPNFLSFYYNINDLDIFNKVKLLNYTIDHKYISKKFAFNKDKKANIVFFDKFLSKMKSLNSDIKLFLGSFPSEISINFIDKETIKLLSNYSDNKDIIVGLQTASNRLLKLTGRNYNLEYFNEKLDIIVNYYNIIIDLIFGLPYETSEDKKTTFNYIKRISEIYNGKIKFNLHYFLPLPGTPFRDKYPQPLNMDDIKKFYALIGDRKGFGNWKAQMEEYFTRIKI